MIDTTILIEYFRKTDKNNSKLVGHFENYDFLYISCITEFEIITGATPAQLQFWNQMLSRFSIIEFDSIIARQAAKIEKQLKTRRKIIDKPDLFIAATAVTNGLVLDSLNRKHFIHINDLDLLPE